MNACPWENQIDDYILGRLGEGEKARFEEHFFNCEACFLRTRERDLLVRAVKAGGKSARAAVPAESGGRPFRVFRPRFALAAAALLFVIAAAVGILPRLGRKAGPWLPPADETVRGATLAVVGPQGLVPSAPEALQWELSAAAAEYEVSLEGPGVKWTKRTREARLALPPEIRAALQPGLEYRWRVRGFASPGYPAGESPAAAFRIGR